MAPLPPVIVRMQGHVDAWSAAHDDRALFLGCYRMMTGRMLDVVAGGGFDDPPWVDRLLHRFADYYFDAIGAHERDPAAAPAAWRAAFRAAGDPGVTAPQKLLLGVNAHINYDLVLTLDELLRDEWPTADDALRARHYGDHRRVNNIIAQTSDAVQDQVLEPAMPAMRAVDWLLGPLDEALIARTIAGWREDVWVSTGALLAAADDNARRTVVARAEAEALATARWLGARTA